MADLKTVYLGLDLRNPLIAGASPLSRKLGQVKQLEDEGVGALVMYSLFEEEITHESLELDYFLNRGTETQPEAQTYMVEPKELKGAGERYLEQLRKIKATVGIPVIASLNGTTPSGWVKLAKEIASAGADALELNIYSLVTDPTQIPDTVEKNYLTLIHNVVHSVAIPVAVKLSPYFTALPNFIQRAYKAGAEGFVLFNRFMQPEFDISALDVERSVRLSTSADLALPARWVALLTPQIKADLALSGGVHTAGDMVAGIMAGARAVMVVSELLKHGTNSAGIMLQEFNDWLDKNGYESVEKMRGTLSLGKVENPATLERANYIKSLQSLHERFI